MERTEDVFAYLRWIDQQVKQHAAGMPEIEKRGEQWQAVAVLIADRRMLVPLDEVRAILPPPRMVALPRAKSWVAGLANMRGELTGVYDLSQFLFDKPNAHSRHNVVLLAKHDHEVAFLVDRSFGIRLIDYGNEQPVDPDQTPEIDELPGVVQTTIEEQTRLPILSLKSLMQDEQFSNVVA